MSDDSGTDSNVSRPVLSLQYSTEANSSWLPVLRAIGVISIVFAGIHFVMSLLAIYLYGEMTGAALVSGMGMSASRVLFIVILRALDLTLLIGGIQCIRSPTTGRRLLLAWAWGSILVELAAAGFIIVGTWQDTRGIGDVFMRVTLNNRA